MKVEWNLNLFQNQNRRLKSVNMGLISHIGDQSMTVTVSSPNDIGFEQQMTLDISDWSRLTETESAMTTLGFRPYSPEISTTLAQIVKTVLHTHCRIRSGVIKIVEINEQPIEQWQSVVELIRADKTSINVNVLRNGVKQQLVLTPKSRAFWWFHNRLCGVLLRSRRMAKKIIALRLQFGVIESVGRSMIKQVRFHWFDADNA